MSSSSAGPLGRTSKTKPFMPLGPRNSRRRATPPFGRRRSTDAVRVRVGVGLGRGRGLHSQTERAVAPAPRLGRQRHGSVELARGDHHRAAAGGAVVEEPAPHRLHLVDLAAVELGHPGHLISELLVLGAEHLLDLVGFDRPRSDIQPESCRCFGSARVPLVSGLVELPGRVLLEPVQFGESVPGSFRPLVQLISPSGFLDRSRLRFRLRLRPVVLRLFALRGGTRPLIGLGGLRPEPEPGRA